MYDPINILKYLHKVISTGKGSSLFDSRRKKYYENIADSPIRVLEWNDYKKILSSFINHQTSDRRKLAEKKQWQLQHKGRFLLDCTASWIIRSLQGFYSCPKIISSKVLNFELLTFRIKNSIIQHTHRQVTNNHLLQIKTWYKPFWLMDILYFKNIFKIMKKIIRVGGNFSNNIQETNQLLW